MSRARKASVAAALFALLTSAYVVAVAQYQMSRDPQGMSCSRYPDGTSECRSLSRFSGPHSLDRPIDLTKSITVSGEMFICPASPYGSLEWKLSCEEIKP